MFAAAGYKRLLSLPLTIETVALKPVRNGRRETTVVEVVGAGEQGFGEDVTHGASDRASFRRLDLGSLSGRRSLAAAVSFVARA